MGDDTKVHRIVEPRPSPTADGTCGVAGGLAGPAPRAAGRGAGEEGGGWPIDDSTQKREFQSLVLFVLAVINQLSNH